MAMGQLDRHDSAHAVPDDIGSLDSQDLAKRRNVIGK